MFLRLSIILFLIASASFAQIELYDWSEPVNLEQINSSANDFAPVFHTESGKLFFNSDKSGKSKFYFTLLNPQNKNWIALSAPTLLSDGINKTSGNQSYLSFSDKTRAVFTSFKLTSQGSVMNIFQSLYEKNNWQTGQIIKSLESDLFRFNPTVSPGGNMMIFSESSTTNPEDADLWVAYRNDQNEWIVTAKLDELNSNMSEITPFLASDDTLYFSSNGFSGKGGYDIYYSVNLNGKWQTPRPLNFLNTEYDESDYTKITPQIAVFSSNRPGGKGNLDLWCTELKKEAILNDEPELKLATSNTEIEVKRFRKFVIANNLVLQKLSLTEGRYTNLNDNLIKIYKDSFSVSPAYLEITVYPKFAAEFNKVEIKYTSESLADSFLVRDAKEISFNKLINLTQEAKALSNSSKLKVTASIVNDADNHKAEKAKELDIFNTIKEIPEEIKIGSDNFVARLLILDDKTTEQSLQDYADFIKNTINSYPFSQKMIVEISPTFEQTQNQFIRAWLKKSFSNIKAIIYQPNIFQKSPDYLIDNHFNYIWLLIQI